ncbi:MAG: lysophospholipid acyltransferase family protein, partial [bacterium]
LQLVRDMQAGKPVAFTLDGPRGPAKQAQPGAVWLAGATGNPLVPFHVEASRYWTANSWDRTQVPKPFATAALVVGRPIEVSKDADDGTIERRRLELESSLGGLEARARELLTIT